MSAVNSVNFLVLKKLVRTVFINPDSKVSRGEMILFSGLVDKLLEKGGEVSSNARYKLPAVTCYERFCSAYDRFLKVLSADQMADLENNFRQSLAASK